jgi:hypothetical protein
MSSSVPPSFPPPDPFASQQAPLPPGKKSNVLLWIVGIVVVVMVGFTAMCGLGGYFLMRKAKQSGFDSALITKNPGYATAKMMVTMNPELDVVSSDDSSGAIVVREKKTGKTMTFKFDAEKKSMVVVDEDGKSATVKLNTDGDKSGIEVQSSDGTVKFGTSGSNQMPAWIPTYPGSTPKGTFSSQTKDGNQSTFAFKTSDAPAKVISYYQDQLKSGGFNITMTTNTPQGGMVMAEDGGKTRSVMLTVGGGSGDGTDVSVTSIEKK